jgi:type 1 glutamine amidotransferase
MRGLIFLVAAAPVFLAGLDAVLSAPAAGGADLAQRIAEAAPVKATASPAKLRRVLVFTLSPGYRHAATPRISRTIELLGKKTGAYQTTITEDASYFEPNSLGQFDAVVMNNNCGACFLPPDFAKLPEDKRKEAKLREARLRKSLEAFVRDGRGFVGIHSCLYTPDYVDWPEYGELIGGLVPGHPWRQKIRVLLDDPNHPLCAAFGGKGFEINEETYQVLAPYSREKVRVLLRLDMTSVDPAKGARKDGDYALAWVKAYGKGRVFYTALTHFEENLADPALLRFYLDGIQFALGDLAADTTPSEKVGRGAPVPAEKSVLVDHKGVTSVAPSTPLQ